MRVVHPDVDVQRPGVVAPHRIAELAVEPLVVLGVDDVLLAIVGPGMRSGRGQAGAPVGGECEQPPPAIPLVGDRVVKVLAAPGADLDLGRDQLARDRVGEHRIRRRGVAQVLEALDEVERAGIEDRELLLQADGEIGRRVELLAGAV